MKAYLDYLLEAKEQKKAVGHFNFSNLEGMHAIIQAAKELDLPVVLGLSEGERDFVGITEAVAMVRALRERDNYPVFLNADHTYSLERVKEAVDAGFDSVIIDAAKLPYEENVALTQSAVDYAKSKNKNILVEAELGYIGQSSKILDAAPEGVDLGTLTTPEMAIDFVTRTGIDLFAPAVGNFHGMLKGGVNPRLNIETIKAISEAVSTPLVLHGGSGADADFDAAIEAGISLVHINTELRKKFMDSLKKALSENPDEIAPYKLFKPVVADMKELVKEKLTIFHRA